MRSWLCKGLWLLCSTQKLSKGLISQCGKKEDGKRLLCFTHASQEVCLCSCIKLVVLVVHMCTEYTECLFCPRVPVPAGDIRQSLRLL